MSGASGPSKPPVQSNVLFYNQYEDSTDRQETYSYSVRTQHKASSSSGTTSSPSMPHLSFSSFVTPPTPTSSSSSSNNFPSFSYTSQVNTGLDSPLYTHARPISTASSPFSGRLRSKFSSSSSSLDPTTSSQFAAVRDSLFFPPSSDGLIRASGARSSEDSTPPLLPSLHISRIKEISSRELPGDRDPCVERIQHIVEKSCLISGKHHEPFEEHTQKVVNGYHVHSYKAVDRDRDTILTALAREEEAAEEDRGQYEFLIFLFRKLTSTSTLAVGGERYITVLSTSKAYKVIHRFCSQDFPAEVLSRLQTQVTKVEQVVTSQLVGPITTSKLDLRHALPYDIEQRRLIYRESSVMLDSFLSQGKQTKVKFDERGVLIYENLTLAQYIEFAEEFGEIAPEAIPENAGPLALERLGLPKQLSPVKQELISKLNERFYAYVAGNREIMNKANFTFSAGISSRASEYRLFFIELVPEWRGSTHRYPVPLMNPNFIPTIHDVRDLLDFWAHKYFLRELNQKRTITNEGLRLEILRRGDISIDYRTDRSWYNIPLLDCFEGELEDLDGRVYFRIGSAWYHIPGSYLQQIDNTVEKVLKESLLSGAGRLLLPWDPNRLNEEPYSRLYPALTDQHGTSWLDANRKQIAACEICDLLGFTADSMFLYHLKKKFDKSSIISASNQLLMSARIIRDCLNQAAPLRGGLLEYCRKLEIKNPAALVNAFKELGKKIYFVLAFPLDAKGIQPLIDAVRGTRSTSLKLELIKLQKGIQELGFSFKICPIPPVRLNSKEGTTQATAFGLDALGTLDSSPDSTTPSFLGHSSSSSTTSNNKYPSYPGKRSSESYFFPQSAGDILISGYYSPYSESSRQYSDGGSASSSGRYPSPYSSGMQPVLLLGDRTSSFSGGYSSPYLDESPSRMFSGGGMSSLPGASQVSPAYPRRPPAPPSERKTSASPKPPSTYAGYSSSSEEYYSPYLSDTSTTGYASPYSGTTLALLINSRIADAQAKYNAAKAEYDAVKPKYDAAKSRVEAANAAVPPGRLTYEVDRRLARDLGRAEKALKEAEQALATAKATS